MYVSSLSVLDILLHLRILKQLYNGVNGLLKLMELLHYLPPPLCHFCVCVMELVGEGELVK